MSRVIDMTGEKVGRLTVISCCGSSKKEKRAQWKCICDCGKEVVVVGKNLRQGDTKSCGCLHIDTAFELGKNNTTHGDTGSRLYVVWQGMIKRCHNTWHHSYKDYGGRGIVVSDEWKLSYADFKIWALNNGYQDNLTIDRIDVNGNYEPDNCRWATMKEQCRNRRNNVRITLGDQTHCIAEWAELNGVRADTLWRRINLYGHSTEKALSEQVRKYMRK